MDAYIDACRSHGVEPLEVVRELLAAEETEELENAGDDPATLPPRYVSIAGNTVPIQMLKRKLGDADVLAVCQGLAAAPPRPTVLIMGYNHLSEDCVGRLAPLLSSFSLSFLNISTCDVGPKACAALVTHLRDNVPTLQQLQLDFNPIGDEGGAAVASLLASHPALAALSLVHSDIGVDTVIQLTQALATNGTLRYLDLSELSITSRNEDMTYHIARALRTNRSLHTLILRKAPIFTETSVASLFDYILDNDGALTELDLSACRLSGPSGVIIARALEAGARLQTLRLSHCRIGDEGAVALSNALMRGCTLRALDVRHNSIGDVGICALADAITGAGSAGGGDEAAKSCLDTLLLEGNELSVGRVGTTTIGQVLLSNLTSTVTDVRPYVVDGVVHLGIEADVVI
jgi:Ran GTPase-activating protein (RanGAP) involved in mRNA processing and transport